MIQGKLKLVEVLKILTDQGIPISKVTFEYYQKIGLLPWPEKIVGKGGRGVYGYYDPNVVEMIKIIYSLKNKGLTLFDIVARMQELFIPIYKKVLIGWVFK